MKEDPNNIFSNMKIFIMILFKSEINRNLKDRFAISSYPSLVFVKNGLYYEYKEKRDPESVFRFAYQDYKNLEGEPIPMEGSFWRSAYKSLGKVK